MTKTCEIKVCGSEFDLVQSQIREAAYSYWTTRPTDELENYTAGGHGDPDIPSEARFLDGVGDFLDLDPAQAMPIDGVDQLWRSGAYVRGSEECTVRISLDAETVFFGSFEDAGFENDEVEEWYDEFLPTGKYIEACYTNEACHTYSLELSEDFEVSRITCVTVDWYGAPLIHRFIYEKEDGEAVEFELGDIDSSGKGMAVRLFSNEE